MHRGKMGQILLGYGLHKDTVGAILMPNKTMNIKIHTPDRDTDFFDFVAGVLSGIH